MNKDDRKGGRITLLSLGHPSAEMPVNEVLIEEVESNTRLALAALCSDYREIRSQIKQLEKTEDDLKSAITDIAKEGGYTKVTGDGWTLSRSAGRRTLKKKILLEKGVPMSVIEEATTPGKPFYTVRGTA